jgi:tetratricopeptide (TPR) repeat protein
MIVRDEAEVIAESIESVRPIADEIVVLDTGSVDNTAEVAVRLGATVRHGVWENDFAAARNRLLRDVTGDWILWLDAGERLASESASDLRAFVNDGDPDRRTAGWVMVETPPPELGQAGEQAARVRLMPNRGDLHFEGRIRETVRPSIESAGLSIVMAPGRILRHRREHDPARKAKKANRDLDLAMLEQGPGDTLPPRALLAMGDAATVLEDWPLARQSFSEAVRTAVRGSTEMLEGYYGLLATFAAGSGEEDERLALGLEALEVFPFDAPLLCAMGGFLQESNRLDLAVKAFETAVQFGRVDLETWHPTDLADTAVLCLSTAYQLQGRIDEARRTLDDSLEKRPDSVRARRGLVELLVREGRTVEALRVAERLPMPPHDREPFRNAVRGACRAVRGEWTAALGYLQSAYVAGCRDPICLRGLAQALLASGQTEGIEPILRQWEAATPGNAEVAQYFEALRTWAAPNPPGDGHGATWVRIDPATTVVAVGPMHVPIVSQVSSIG